jgi:flagellar hook-associated protein 1 FlgK
MAEKIGEQRDNLSAVSLDEEMINMMKYQHAYTVASKLLTVADELLMTLINSKP